MTREREALIERLAAQEYARWLETFQWLEPLSFADAPADTQEQCRDVAGRFLPVITEFVAEWIRHCPLQVRDDNDSDLMAELWRRDMRQGPGS